MEIFIEMLAGTISTLPVLMPDKKSKWFRVAAENGSSHKVYVKSFIDAKKGDRFIGRGEFRKTYFAPSKSMWISPPETREHVLESLRAAVPRISEDAAKRIVIRLRKVMGTDQKVCHQISELAELLEVDGNLETAKRFLEPELSPEHVPKFLKWWRYHHDIRALKLLGLKKENWEEMSRMTLLQLREQLESNPLMIYELSDETLVSIVQAMGLNPSDEEITMFSAAQFIYSLCKKKKWMGVPLERLQHEFNATGDEDFLVDFVEKYKIHFNGELLFLQEFHEIEVGIAERFARLLKYRGLPTQKSVHFYSRSLDESQKVAVKMALTEPLSIITGPPGSGKTTIIRQLVKNLEDSGQNYALLQLTGQATCMVKKRLKSSKPSTIHRFMIHNRDEKLDHVIFDECGMISPRLLWQFFQKFPGNYRITFIGDPNQIRAIEPGDLISPLIECSMIPRTQLTGRYRFSSDLDEEGNPMPDGILTNLEMMLTEEEYEPVMGEYFLISEESEVKFIQQMVELLSEDRSPDSVSVICPYRNSADGKPGVLDELNELISKAFNGDKPSLDDDFGATWRIDDRVTLTSNNYTLNLTRGDVGRVIAFDEKIGFVRVRFPDEQEIDFSTLRPSRESQGFFTKMLKKHFANTINSFQGSETEYVIMWIPHGRSFNPEFLNLNLMYTGVSRAMCGFYCVGDTDAFIKACNTPSPPRLQGLVYEITSRCS